MKYISLCILILLGLNPRGCSKVAKPVEKFFEHKTVPIPPKTLENLKDRYNEYERKHYADSLKNRQIRIDKDRSNINSQKAVWDEAENKWK